MLLQVRIALTSLLVLLTACVFGQPVLAQYPPARYLDVRLTIGASTQPVQVIFTTDPDESVQPDSGTLVYSFKSGTNLILEYKGKVSAARFVTGIDSNGVRQRGIAYVYKKMASEGGGTYLKYLQFLTTSNNSFLPLKYVAVNSPVLGQVSMSADLSTMYFAREIGGTRTIWSWNVNTGTTAQVFATPIMAGRSAYDPEGDPVAQPSTFLYAGNGGMIKDGAPVRADGTFNQGILMNWGAEVDRTILDAGSVAGYFNPRLNQDPLNSNWALFSKGYLVGTDHSNADPNLYLVNTLNRRQKQILDVPLGVDATWGGWLNNEDPTVRTTTIWYNSRADKKLYYWDISHLMQ